MMIHNLSTHALLIKEGICEDEQDVCITVYNSYMV